MKGPQHDDDDGGSIAEINIIPLVDVVLVLLIIFMVTTVFSRDSALELELPKGYRATTKSQPPVEITISVDKKEHIFVNNKPTDIQDLRTRIAGLQNSSRKTVIVLRGDKKVAYGSIMPVLDEISRTGVDVTLALTPGEH